MLRLERRFGKNCVVCLLEYAYCAQYELVLSVANAYSS